MLLKAGEDIVLSKPKLSQGELEGRIVTDFDVSGMWEQEQLFMELDSLLPDQYKGVNFHIMKNCHGNLIKPNSLKAEEYTHKYCYSQ